MVSSIQISNFRPSDPETSKANVELLLLSQGIVSTQADRSFPELVSMLTSENISEILERL